MPPWEKLPFGRVTFRPASPIEYITVRGREAVMFLDHSWHSNGVYVLIDEGDRIIDISYPDNGNAGVQSAFATVVASLDWTRSPQEGFGRNLAVDQALKQRVDEILAGYSCTRQAMSSWVNLDPDGVPGPPSPYKLPWQSGVTRTVTQGIGGSYSHTCPGQMCYAYDFDLPMGAAVKASRAGTVAYSVGTYTQCGNQSLSNYGNRVVVNHSDGLATLYLHLNSVAVGQGNSVSQGQTVGYSGQTGWTGCSAHLHFQLQAQGLWITNSTPAVFDEYPSTLLVTGGRYTSRNPN